jgi:RNA polymerase sigma factor (TIGR02999 family)
MESKPRTEDVTGLLHLWSQGDEQAFERLVPLVYDELRRLAGTVLRQEGPRAAVQRTALVHELYLKMVAQDRAQWRDREQFFGIAVKMMRRLIVDDARQRLAAKRGAGAVHLPVEEQAIDQPSGAIETTLAVDTALTRFAQLDPERSRIVELRYFGGMDLAEIAELLGVSRTTVKRQWTVARMWLHRELAGPPRDDLPRNMSGRRED